MCKVILPLPNVYIYAIKYSPPIISDVTPKRFFQIENDILNITLETSSDIGHQLVTQAFAIFLREVLKYDSVNIVTYTDHFNINSSSQILQRLSGMDLLDNGAALLSNSR